MKTDWKQEIERSRAYRLKPLRASRPTALIVGAGGTGGFAAEALCRLFTGTPFNLAIVDPDIVEPHNLLRQNFEAADIGRPKAQVLAERLSRKFAVPVSYGNQEYRKPAAGRPDGLKGADLLIGCVDRASARQSMEQALEEIRRPEWYIDAGNGPSWGQVLLGNTKRPAGNSIEQYLDPYERGEPGEPKWARLPSPATQQPDLLLPEPPEEPEIDCAQAINLTGQDPVINRVMADLIAVTVKKLLTGECDYMGIYLNLETVSMHPVKATPENVIRAMGGPKPRKRQ